MEANQILSGQISGILESQIQLNNPPEVVTTLERLQKEGLDEAKAKQLIGQCLSFELFNAIENGESFNNERYVRNLNGLPSEPTN